MQTSPKRRRFYTIITIVVLVAIVGSAALIVVYIDESYVRIEVVGTSDASFVVAYDSTSVTLSASENVTVEVLPHVNVTVTAVAVTPYTVVHWDISGAAATQKGQDAIVFPTGEGGSVIRVSAKLATNSSG